MSKYRIIEKEGTVNREHEKGCWYGLAPGYNHCICQGDGVRYTPRFIVQELVTKCPDSLLGGGYATDEFQDLKEFKKIEEAKDYKRSLELKDGIVVG